jgi:hypothetical protein
VKNQLLTLVSVVAEDIPFMTLNCTLLPGRAEGSSLLLPRRPP